MTLILTTMQSKGCVMTADGALWGQGKAINHQQQKLFPIPEASMAIAQFGLNPLGGLPVSELINEFFALRKAKLPALTPLLIAHALAAFIQSHAYVSLKAEELLAETGLVVVGFGSCCHDPHCFELFWCRALDRHVDFSMKSHQGVVVHGDAGGVIRRYANNDFDEQFSPRFLRQRDPLYAQQFHELLYKEAVDKETANSRPDGHRHQILIEPHGWHWIEPLFEP